LYSINGSGITELITVGRLSSLIDTPCKIENLRQKFTAAVESTTKETLAAVIEDFNFFSIDCT
jgi:hypothetical protein